MVDAKYFMATERNGYNGQIFEALKNRFPEIPEQVISQTLQAEHGNAERCLSILSAESDRFLYGGSIDMLDSPMPVQPSSQNTPIDEPISISIPQSNTSPYLPNRTVPPPLQPLIRPMTLAQPSPGMGYVSPGPGERLPPSTSTSYDQTLLCHQRQRLDTLKKEMYNEHRKLLRLKNELQEKDMEMVNLKFRVAANPTSADVRHLREENHHLREEIEQMTREIDQLSNGRDVIGHPSNNPAQIQPYQPPPVRRVESYPSSRPHSHGANGEESPSSLSPPPDGSLTNEWEFVPPNLPATVHSSEETTWTCTFCTFANHEALEVCEICEMPRNRALDARA
ncbi:uncharacterized protein LOC144656084 isoform X2 [Oculina patagonica]